MNDKVGVIITIVIGWMLLMMTTGCCTNRQNIKDLEKIVIDLDNSRKGVPCYQMETDVFMVGLHLRQVIEQMKYPHKEW